MRYMLTTRREWANIEGPMSVTLPSEHMGQMNTKLMLVATTHLDN